MAALGRVLGTLPDDAARKRVLRWACERFGLDQSAVVALVPEAMMAKAVNVADDPALKIDSLDDMFEMASPDNDDLTLPVSEPAHAAPAAPLDQSRQPVETVLRSFVKEFQRFAEEWNGATA
jgi:hypothetical protein